MSFLICQSTTIIESSSGHPGDNAECDFGRDELCGPQRPVLSVLTYCYIHMYKSHYFQNAYMYVNQ